MKGNPQNGRKYFNKKYKRINLNEFQVHMNWEMFRKGRETRDQIANILRIMEKAREFQKNIYFCFIAFVWITTNCGKFLKRWGYRTTVPDS